MCIIATHPIYPQIVITPMGMTALIHVTVKRSAPIGTISQKTDQLWIMIGMITMTNGIRRIHGISIIGIYNDNKH
jgi:hypothetical protein